MYRIISLAGIVLFCLILSSCKKEMSVENNNIVTPPPPPPQNILDSNYLDKMYYVEFDGTNFDTISVLCYTYDNQKRVISRVDSMPAYPSNPIYENITYYYNGTDTLPFKSKVLQDNSPLMMDTIITYFTYNNLGQKIKDSLYHFSYNASFVPAAYGIKRTIINYSYGTNKLYSESKDSLIYQINANLGIGRSKDTAVLDVMGNVIANKHYSFNISNFILTYTSQLTYDNHPSPFARLSNFKTFKQMNPGSEYVLGEFPQPNNVLTVIGTSISGTVLNYNYSAYSYNSRGYPTQVVIPDAAPPTYTKYVFVYRAL